MKVLICFVVLVLSSTAYADSIKWDANQDADYYVVYWGEAQGNYLENSDNIIVTEFDISAIDKKYQYFAVKAFNSCGNSSDFAEIQYCKPVGNIDNLIIEKVDINITVNIN